MRLHAANTARDLARFLKQALRLWVLLAWRAPIIEQLYVRIVQIACVIATFLGTAFHAAEAQDHVPKVNLPWIRNVEGRPVRAYLEVTSNSNRASNVETLWLHMRSNAPRRYDRLTPYTMHTIHEIKGCLGSASEKCDVISPTATQTLARIDTCLRDQLATHYFVAQKNDSVICLMELPQEIKRGVITGDVAMLANVDARWVRGNNKSTRHLNDLFATAPFWQPSDRGIASIACGDVVGAVAAYSTQDVWKEFDDQAQFAELSTPHLIWAWVYLIKQVTPIRCGIASFWVDHANRPFAILPDGTALIHGQQTVVRIRMSDGGTEAPSQLVKRVPAREYVERMVADGQPDCVTPGKTKLCHWIGERNPSPEDDYARHWFEGFDRAVSRIYFNK